MKFDCCKFMFCCLFVCRQSHVAEEEFIVSDSDSLAEESSMSDLELLETQIEKKAQEARLVLFI